MAHEIKYADVKNTLLSEVGYQGQHYNSKFTEFLDSISWYNYPKKNACTWCCILADYAIAVNKGDLTYEQARQVTCEPANHASNAGAGVKDKAQYFKSAKRWISSSKDATTGDQIFLDSLNHLGTVVDWDKTGLIVVDGSTTYEGKPYSVGKKHIPYKSNRIVGFGRPDWYRFQTADVPSPAAPDPKPSNNSGYTDAEIQAAYDCIEGKYGNGKARGNNLLQAGFDYYRVQGLVNKILKGEFRR